MKQYYNYKNFYSVILLALVDAHYRFIWASIGAPGNTHDSTLFQSTNLRSRITSCEIFPAQTLAKPYGDAVLTEQKRYFNCKLSRTRMVTEGECGKLKGRWRVLFEEV